MIYPQSILDKNFVRYHIIAGLIYGYMIFAYNPAILMIFVSATYYNRWDGVIFTYNLIICAGMFLCAFIFGLFAVIYKKIFYRDYHFVKRHSRV